LQLSNSEKAIIRAKNAERNHVDGKFGQAKNSFGLSRTRARRADTSAAWISGIFLALDLTRLLKIIPLVGLILHFIAKNALTAQIIRLLWSFEDRLGAAVKRNWRRMKKDWQHLWMLDRAKMDSVYG
jgi:hypothetical protein